MDENPRYPDRLLAPPAEGGGSAMRLPGGREEERARWPSVEDHLVEPEVTRDEVVRGRRMEALASNPPHADKQFELGYVLRSHLRDEYVGSTELLTRVGPDSDFATDVCIRKRGVDPETGVRYLEEVAFEVANEQRRKELDVRAEDLTARGVRRIFAIDVKKGEVHEWAPRWRRWRRLGSRAILRDPCFERPLSVRALLDAAAADDAVVRALLARQSPAVREHDARVEARVKAEMVLTILRARGLEVSREERERVLGCTDPAILDRWAERAAVVGSAAAVFGG